MQICLKQNIKNYKFSFHICQPFKTLRLMTNQINAQKTPPLTVSQLTNAIKLSLETTFPMIVLQGEMSNFKIQSSGHLYFSLKDANAQIAAVMFKPEASFLKVMPKAGDQVIVRAELNVYPPKGNYQLIVRELSYVGIGELLLKLEALKVKLHQLGWFKAANKKPLPRFPRRIGVVTSPTGAVIQDILNVLTRRFSGFHLILNPVKVQGEGSAQEIAQAIEQFNRHGLVDVIIVGRGGGSLEDLWAFNEEVVAAAIHDSHIPIISAVGHETDHCIADYVADIRAPTPSAAAEIVIAEKNQQLDYLIVLRKRMQQTIGHLIQKNRYRLNGILKHPFFTHPHGLIEWRMQKLDDYKPDLEQTICRFLNLKKQLLEAKSQQALALKPMNQISQFKLRFNAYRRTLQNSMNQLIEQYRQKLAYKKQQLDHIWQTKQSQRRHSFNQERLSQNLQQILSDRLFLYRQKLTHTLEILQALDPQNVLDKGYSILFAEKSPFVINSVAKLKKGQQARLVMSDGEILVTINEVILRASESPSRPKLNTP
jgi:exodeoxyribonuclease VII large subunit